MAAFKRSKMMDTYVDVDRLSGLPDEIIDHIFSFMDMKFVVRTCVLSKRWTNLWKSASTLNFRLLHKSYQIRHTMKSAFMHFVDQVFHFHDDSHMMKFSLSCGTETEASRVCSWVKAAIDRNVEVVCLRSIPKYHNEVPNHHIFTSNKITTVNLTCTQVSNSMCSAHWIKSLTLYMVYLPDMDAHGQLNLTWPDLETLVLRDCRLSGGGVLTLSIPLSKKLELINLYACGGEQFKVFVSCPNLTSLKCLAENRAEYCFGDLPLLHSADIHLSKMSREVYGQRLENALKSVCNANVLKLTTSLFKQCGKKKADLGEDLPLQEAFISLKTFKIWGARLDDVELKFMEFLLKRAKLLKNISVKAKKGKSMDLKEFKEKLLVSAKDSSSYISVSVQTMETE